MLEEDDHRVTSEIGFGRQSTTKRNLLGVLVDAVDYAVAVDKTTAAAVARRAFPVSALAVHGLMIGALDRVHRYRLNHFALLTPDGQPVRWALDLIHGAKLRDRVYGPRLMLCLCERACRERLPVYLYGSSKQVVEALRVGLTARFPSLTVAGAEPSIFGVLSARERAALVGRVRSSGARILFVGLGCPRQEVFAFECASLLEMPVVAVGAAFDYHSGVLKEPPGWIQDAGLQWVYRLFQRPSKLWKRYLFLNPLFIALAALQYAGLFQPLPEDAVPPSEHLSVG